jgi:excisionase family DNA binding protein
MEGKEGLLKIGAVAERLGISIPHAYRLAQTGEIPCIRVGEKSVRFDPEDVETYIRSHRRRKTA